MAKKSKTNRTRAIGNQSVEKKPLIDPKTRSRLWTIVILLVLLIFFIVNNTKEEPEQGPYPPNYTPRSLNSN
jgi:uncharacterized integral membrane protein